MKPFVAVTVLVAASLTAASAASVQQQQQQLAAAGSRGGALGQHPASGASLQLPGGSSGSSWSFGPSFVGGPFGAGAFGFGPAPFGGSSLQGSGLGAASSGSPSLSAPGGAGRHSGSLSGQVPSGGSNGYSQFPGVWGVGYYPSQGYGQSFYSPYYGSIPSWGYNPGYVSGQWSLPGYNYGGGFGGFSQVPFGYGSSSGSAQGPVGAGQLPAALPGAPRSSSSRSSSQQLAAGRQ